MISTHVSAMARACATVCTCESPMAHARVNVCITGGVRQAQEALKRAIASADAGAIVKAMREHPANAAIQRKGCEALRNLAVKSAENKTLIAQVGGIEALVTAMQGHATDPGVQEQACAALLNLSSNNPENKVKISNLGSEEHVRRAMAAANATEVTKRLGQWLLDRLAAKVTQPHSALLDPSRQFRGYLTVYMYI